MITNNNRNDFYHIVFDNLNFFDFSDFIKLRGASFCKRYQDYGMILEYYKDSVFAKDDVVEFLQKGVYQELKYNIESILLEDLDAEECASCDSIEYALDSFLERIQEEYSFLTEDEIDSIRNNVDSRQIAQENQESFYEYEDDSIQNEQDEKGKIDDLFGHLL